VYLSTNLDLNTIVQELIQAIEMFSNHYPYRELKQHLALDCKLLVGDMNALNPNEYEQMVSEIV
jgi:hypothetical protein